MATKTSAEALEDLEKAILEAYENVEINASATVGDPPTPANQPSDIQKALANEMSEAIAAYVDVLNQNWSEDHLEEDH